MTHKPFWFKDGEIVSINAPTCGINKDGHEQYIVETLTGEYLDEIDDQLSSAVDKIFASKSIVNIPHVSSIKGSIMDLEGIAVPQYYDKSSQDEISSLFLGSTEFDLVTLGELEKRKLIIIRPGHGSPSQDQRTGDVAYIKVSDLRSGTININPTNMIPLALAETFWKGKDSKIKIYDLVSPVRASKNIGEFCMVLHGQDKVVMTKEVIVIRCLDESNLNQFYLAWALSLEAVRRQWDRIVFMQTNREDVGKRYKEIIIPYPKDAKIAEKYSKPFREYYINLESGRKKLLNDLSLDPFKHQVYL